MRLPFQTAHDVNGSFRVLGSASSGLKILELAHDLETTVGPGRPCCGHRTNGTITPSQPRTAPVPEGRNPCQPPTTETLDALPGGRQREH
jgi:hypothetical protein